jgi:hypothetical protein
MTGDQVFAAVTAGMVIWGVVAITKKILDGREKKMRQAAETQRQKILADSVTQAARDTMEDRQKTLELMIKTPDATARFKNASLASLKEIGKENALEVNGNALSHDTLVERTTKERTLSEKSGTIIKAVLDKVL